MCRSCEARHGGLCSVLTSAQLTELNKHSIRRRIDSGNEVIGQGEQVGSYSNILKGVIKLSKMMADGRQQIVGLQFAPDFLGRPFLGESTITAEAATDTEICTFPRNIVDRMVGEVPDMERKLHGLDFVALRASNPYGPRQGHAGLQGIIGTYLWKIARGEQIEVWGDGSVIRDFIDVRDLAALSAIALESPINGCFNAGSGEGASVKRIVELTAQITGRDLSPLYRPGRGFDVPRIILDIARIRKAVGWNPTIPLEQGMRDSWDWICQQQQVSAVA